MADKQGVLLYKTRLPGTAKQRLAALADRSYETVSFGLGWAGLIEAAGAEGTASLITLGSGAFAVIGGFLLGAHVAQRRDDQKEFFRSAGILIVLLSIDHAIDRYMLVRPQTPLRDDSMPTGIRIKDPTIVAWKAAFGRWNQRISSEMRHILDGFMGKPESGLRALLEREGFFGLRSLDDMWKLYVSTRSTQISSEFFFLLNQAEYAQTHLTGRHRGPQLTGRWK